MELYIYIYIFACTYHTLKYIVTSLSKFKPYILRQGFQIKIVHTAFITRSFIAHRGWFFEELDGHPGLLHGGFTSAIVDDFTGLAAWSLAALIGGVNFAKTWNFYWI